MTTPTSKHHRLRALLATLIIAPLGLGAALAQDVPKFPIASFKVEGNSLLQQADIDAVLKPYVGTRRDFGDVQEALEALETAYRNRGYSSVSVLLPEQVLERGEVKLQVVEARIRKVTVSGQKFFDPANIRASVPSIKEGEVPLMDDISASLRVANENPAKKITVQLNPGDKDEDLDAAIKVVDEMPWKVGVTLDNSGTAQSGRERLGLTYQHSNLFDRDHILTLQYQTSPAQTKAVQLYAAVYRIPLYEMGDVIDIYATHSEADSGLINAGTLNLNVTGKGSTVGIKYTNKLKRMGDYEHEVTYGLDGKSFDNTLGPTRQELLVYPLSVTYSGRLVQEGSELGFNVGAIQNIPGGTDGSQAAVTAARAGADKNYNAIRAGASFSQALPEDWQWRAIVSAQWAADPLIPGEQFGVGGANSVRGFNERDIASDKGVQGNLELYSPELCSKALSGHTCRVLGFYDFGALYRNDPLPQEAVREHVASTGLGLRWTLGRDVAFQADYAKVIQGGGSQSNGDWKVHARFGIFF